jgi:FkbM family methyltransferase
MMLLDALRRLWRTVAGPEATLSQIALAPLRTVRGNLMRVRINGHPFTVDLRDTIVSFDILTRRRDGFLRGPMVYEPLETAIVAQLIRPGDRVIDVGAHIGFYSILFGRAVGERGRVLAIEPHPDNAAVLATNIRDNGLESIVRVERVAAGASDGKATLFVNKYGNRGDNRMYRNDAATREIALTLRPIDALVSDWERVDLIKMDVQGFEPQALAGMSDTLERNHEVILFTEFWPHGLRSAGGDPASMLRTLRGHGFDLAEITPRGLELVDDGQLIARLTERRHTDLVCARPDVLRRRNQSIALTAK